MSDLKIIPAVLDRFDLKFNVKPEKNEEEIRTLAYGMCEQEDKIAADYSPFLKKYIAFSKGFNPKLSDEAKSVLTEHFVSVRMHNPKISPRRQQTLFNLARARARLQLKKTADLNDANAIIEFHARMVTDYETTTKPPEDPMDNAYRECVTILREFTIGNLPIPITLDELLKTACQKNRAVNSYLHLGGRGLRMRQNKKVRNLYEMLILNNNIKIVKKNPTVLQWQS